MKLLSLAGLLLLLSPMAFAAGSPIDLISPCLDCHETTGDAPANQVLLGSHGIEGEGLEDRRGCLDCHGDSAGHIEQPEKIAPDISFGPRWTASPAAQDAPCLDCHEDNTAGNWRHALHMVNNMTCITCHDIHAEQDNVLVPSEQLAVCTTCHKAQKSGIHGLADVTADDPPCSLCHNPHNHEAARPQMHANGSAGCLVCHGSEQMQMGGDHQPLRDCLDCHQGIAHAPESSAAPLHPEAVQGRGVALFYPGHASRQWLLRDHPGSQPLRQGTGCQRCHRGDEAEIGAAMAPGLEPSSRVVGIAFATGENRLNIELNWSGGPEDRQLALMWGSPANPAFSRGGCFAACHDTGPRHTTTMGGPAIEQGIELWRIQLESGEVKTSLLGTDSPGQAVAAQVGRNNGQWQVNLTVALDRATEGILISGGDRYTFGLALHTTSDHGREHLVSLPMTLGFGTEDTDFSAQ